MTEENQDLDNIKDEQTVGEQLPKSQKNLVVILSVLVIILFGIVVYFLIKDEIIQLPFLNTQQDNLVNVEEEIDKKESSESEKSEVVSESGDEEKESKSSIVEEEAEDVNTPEWLTYQLDNPKISFKYPSDEYKIEEDTRGQDYYLDLTIYSSVPALKLHIFEAVGGPGVGGLTEVDAPEDISVIGKFLGMDIIRIENDGPYKYASYVHQCEDCSDSSFYEPYCSCQSIDNYVMNPLFETSDVNWVNSKGGETYITIEVDGELTPEVRDTYETILLSFKTL